MRKYLEIRFAVGLLGEQAQFNWWNTSFFSPASNAFLSPIFSKTKFLAQYQGVRRAAQRVHDNYIGLGRVYHLFRLSEEIEQYLFQLLLQEKFDKDFFNKLNSKENALKLLETDSQAIIISEGPVLAGKTNSIMTHEAMVKISQIYVSAFNGNTKIYPYFAG